VESPSPPPLTVKNATSDPLLLQVSSCPLYSPTGGWGGGFGVVWLGGFLPPRCEMCLQWKAVRFLRWTRWGFRSRYSEVSAYPPSTGTIRYRSPLILPPATTTGPLHTHTHTQIKLPRHERSAQLFRKRCVLPAYLLKLVSRQTNLKKLKKSIQK